MMVTKVVMRKRSDCMCLLQCVAEQYEQYDLYRTSQTEFKGLYLYKNSMKKLKLHVLSNFHVRYCTRTALPNPNHDSLLENLHQ